VIRNLVIEYRDAQGKPERFPALAAELVAFNVDVIVAGGGTLGAHAAKRATTSQRTVPVPRLRSEGASRRFGQMGA